MGDGLQNTHSGAEKRRPAVEARPLRSEARNVCRYRRVGRASVRSPAMSPTRPSEATLMRPRAFEGRFLVGVAGLAGIEVPPARGSMLPKVVERRDGGESHVWGMRPGVGVGTGVDRLVEEAQSVRMRQRER